MGELFEHVKNVSWSSSHQAVPPTATGCVALLHCIALHCIVVMERDFTFFALILILIQNPCILFER